MWLRHQPETWGRICMQNLVLVFSDSLLILRLPPQSSAAIVAPGSIPLFFRSENWVFYGFRFPKL